MHLFVIIQKSFPNVMAALSDLLKEEGSTKSGIL